ncbi:hypothetical protein GOV11_04415, partial [Candidatus Woesearchaeota archaeon]|nr:hypothetical protein [Candidatus Woesearchaeota archaeon]
MTLRQLIENGTLSVAMLPEMNSHLLNEKGLEYRENLVEKQDTETYHSLSTEDRLDYLELDQLDKLDGYTVPLIAHDYGAKTPLMWNKLYEQLGLNLQNIMVVGNPKKSSEILDVLKQDPKYLGGGAGVGFKEAVLPYVQLHPKDLQSVNIIVNKNGELQGHNTDALGFVMSLENKLQDPIDGNDFVIYGAGGVAKEVGRLLANKGAKSLAIINRTVPKAVSLAATLNKEYPDMNSFGVGENLSRGVLLNSWVHPVAVINTSDKGSDKFKDDAFYAATGPDNENTSRTVLRYLKELLPDVVIADIVIPAKGESISLRLAKAEGLTNLLNGIPMVVNQAAPAYKLVEEANPGKHKKTVTE